MCWSGEASTVLATIGISTTIYAAYKKEPAPLWMALGYFSLMEALQAYTYMVINQCHDPRNQIATLLGYLHIAFQPFFINAISLYFVPKEIQRKVAPLAYALCFASTIFMIIQLYPFDWAGTCAPQRPLCAKALCSVSGNWHIAWNVPINGIGNSLTAIDVPFIRGGYLSYAIVAFLIPMLYGSWRMTLYQFTMGPAIARLLTNNLNEWPAVWCLLSIGLLLIAVKTPLRKHLHVKHWFLWPQSWIKQEKKGKVKRKEKARA